MADRTKGIPWSWLAIAALAGFALALPVAMQRPQERMPDSADEWMDAYVRGCLADEHQPV